MTQRTLPTTAVPESGSARRLLSRGQALAAAGAALPAGAAAMADPALTGLVLTAAASVLYVAVIAFKVLLTYGHDRSHVMRFGPGELPPDDELPVYTVLVPLYRESNILRALLERLAALDYPHDRRQILLLVEEDDEETRDALPGELPPGFEVVVIPAGHPRTKPKACNVGLRHARGEFCVIFDAEDQPEPLQLRKAVAAFRSSPRWMVCVQAELQYWNPWTNWLTRCFAAEYAHNFGLFLHGLDRFRLPIPLGGTSNHFRTSALRDLGAWDPYNVTEDADLGIRIARRGWSVRMMESVTLEEANCRLGNWLRQRSRWIKGYCQTWLVHMRAPVRLWRELGPRGFAAFQLAVGFSTLTTLLNPIFWAMTALYLVAGSGPIAGLFPGPVLYTAVASMLAGNLLLMHGYMAGCLERGLHAAVRTMLFVPVYWALMSVAAYRALWQLLRPSRRHYWELTEHGLIDA
ncbi:glycosyltransferase [Nonomuraea sp. NPDC059023]|uniref:glycosyltransferase n=1 Tax=unclassified Nonomuraea TaxID=2593643 RepID=UPI003688A243